MSLLGLERRLGPVRRREIGRFAVVGATGVAVNNLVLFLVHGLLGLPLIIASPLAVESAIVNNFLWNDRWTFSHREKTAYRFVTFNLISLGGLVVNTTVLALVVAVTGLHYLIGNLIGIGAAMTWNYAANSRWTWKSRLDGMEGRGRPEMRREETP